MAISCGCFITNSPEPQFRLIQFCPLHAAAPEMLAALKDLESYLGLHEHNGEVCGYCVSLVSAREIIAKAEGKP